MMGYVDAPTAWWLTHGMARTIGVSLPHAVVEGWLTRRELEKLVDRCQCCGKSEYCTPWLAKVAQAQALPGFCDNKAEIEALAPEE